MSDRSDYLDRVRARLPLPPAEAEEALAEVADHLDDAVADLVERGVDPAAAERVAAARLGSPETLASEIARAHRSPRHVLAAAGTAVRVTIGTGFWGLLEAWAALLLMVVGVGMTVTLVSRLVGREIVWGGYAPHDLNALLGALIPGLAAFAIGRAVLPPVARAARRTTEETRLVLLPLGIVVSGAIGLFVIRAEYGITSALLAALLPAWFALGMLRPDVLPSWFPGSPRTVGAILLVLAIGILVPVGFLVSAGAGAPDGSSVESVASMPAEPDWSRIAPLRADHGTFFVSSEGGQSGASVQLSGTLSNSNALDGWTDLHVEIWRGGAVPQSGPWLPSPEGTGPVATWPLTVDGSTVSADGVITPRPDTELYLVAEVGTAPSGQRYLLVAPTDAVLAWSGSAWDYFTSPR